jgi:uncharacterized protein DUF6152
MRIRLVMVFAVAVGLLMSVPLVAHHSASTLYTEKTVTLKGIVKTWRWSNPHCLLSLDVKGEDGQVVQWLAETQAPNTVYIDGYRANSFKAGDEVTVTVRAAANGRPYGLLTQAVLADGTKLGTEEGARGRGATAQ